MPATGASMLLNAEGVLTALLAWFVFKENFDRRIALGMLAIVAGAVLLSWPRESAGYDGLGVLAVVGACLAWAIDNNLTRKVSLSDASFIAMIKGLAAGSTNLLLAWLLGATWPGGSTVASAAVLGFLSYGASLVLFVVALRHLGTARTGAYFSVAPFFGALLGVFMLDEPVPPVLVTAGCLMALGVWLHLTEQHGHLHTMSQLVTLTSTFTTNTISTRMRAVWRMSGGTATRTCMPPPRTATRTIPTRPHALSAAALSAQPQEDRSAWTGGHFTVPNEQNTQQSPCLGRSTVLQFSHS